MYVGTVFWIVSLIRTPAHATRMPSGRDVFGVDDLYLAAKMSREAYEVLVALSTSPTDLAHSNHYMMTLALAGGKEGLVS